MNGLKGEKGDPADLSGALGLRVSKQFLNDKKRTDVLHQTKGPSSSFLCPTVAYQVYSGSSEMQAVQ